MRFVIAPLVGQDPGDVGGGGGVDEFCLLFWWRASAHCDDEGVVAKEGGGEAGGVVVVDFGDKGAGGYGGVAVGAGEGGYFVLSCLEQRLDDESADVAACLFRRGLE